MARGIPMKLVTFFNHVTTCIVVRTHWRHNISILIAIFKYVSLCVTMLTVWSFLSVACEISVNYLERSINKLTSQSHRFTRRSVIGKLVVLFLLLDQGEHFVNARKGLNQHDLISSIGILVIQTHKKLCNIISLIPFIQHFQLTTCV